ncbi:cation transporter [Bradymonadaceae bacterium TMQ3]|uniref:Cation transporter n=1 Tax=Lujinxingia sediminis TaxID=2480984 RepID=A0ABY0CZE0_9DELT|nr:ChaB family protein [Lujinxingia sediminis]RDV39145.1 cation transporter [Bradymonadaceae bacterium TMQ3]RVU48810.1 cation transporter [Lujinxingia sediminis]TXC78103.1 cation transporter [Bradymonadales bacterium TMQ1]
MPYQRNADLPKNVRDNLPKHGQEIYRKAFNSASEQHDEEKRAHKVAWSAVKTTYKKSEGEWKRKD